MCASRCEILVGWVEDSAESRCLGGGLIVMGNEARKGLDQSCGFRFSMKVFRAIWDPRWDGNNGNMGTGMGMIGLYQEENRIIGSGQASVMQYFVPVLYFS